MENIQMFNVGIARLLELGERGEALGWRRARLGGAPVQHPGTRTGATGPGGAPGGLPAAPRAAPQPLIIYRRAAARGEIARQLGGEGTGTFPRCVSPSGHSRPARRASAAVPQPGAGAAPGALPQLRRAGASRAHPAGTGIARLGDRSACDSGKFCSGRAAGRAARTAGLRRFSAAGPCGSPAPRVFPVRWRRMFPDPCRAERALTTKELRFLLFSRGLVRM